MEDNREKIDKLKKPLGQDIESFTQWANDSNIFSKITRLNPELWGFVYRSSNHNYYIIINKDLSHEIQQKVFIHEVKHIISDMPTKPYLIGLDMQHSGFEKKADLFAQNHLNKLK
ncbi:ImmA/IrrE family metallo-endopeptidase [Halonatronum saccharophilum]|uniref:ImmA/IrrE family metallo-endopeptidase n=1 Tax=Halonatronum saccharophilum TaxID=150060 RepID=UPI0004836511|nr:hypothetical protein [Halonatronum saccharophilum]